MSRLCSVCEHMLHDLPTASRDAPHHQSSADLQRSAEDGCFICSAVWGEISHSTTRPSTDEAHHDGPDTDQQPVHPVTQYNVLNIRNPELHISSYRGKLNKPTYIKTFILECIEGMRSSSTHDSDDGYKTPQQADTTSIAAQPLFDALQAQKWLQQCLEHHEKCRLHSSHSSHSSRPYPTRLVEIDQPVFGHCRLWMTKDTSQEHSDLRYATLSYCWGQADVFTLTTETLPRLEFGIPIMDLGRTSRDAIAVARELGIFMVWIDSLCIIQDSRDDWFYEAPRMTYIYQNAVFNIAAVVSTTRDSSFWPRNVVPNMPKPPVVVIQGAARWRQGRYAVHRNDIMKVAFENMPLMGRAWVVQELLLSPRILYFCESQLFWQCAELNACQTLPQGIPKGLWEHGINHDMRMEWRDLGVLAQTAMRTVGEDYAGFQRRKLWAQTVNVFSKGALTFPSDKLAAISGLAKLYREATHDEYYAGLWRQDLPYQLMWFNTSPSHPKPYPLTQYPPQEYRAPTWSWACIDGQVNMFYEGAAGQWKPVVHMQDCHINTCTNDTTVGILDGYLRLSGWLITMTIRMDSNSQYDGSIFVDGKWIRMMGIIKFDRKIHTEQVHILPILVDTPENSYPGLKSLPSAMFLLLYPTEERKGWFYRAGIFYRGLTGLILEGGDHDAFRHIQNEPWLEYESIDNNGEHVVVIV